MEMPKIEVYTQFYGRINRRTASGQRVVSLRCEDLTIGFLPDCENPDGRNRCKARQEPELAEPMYDPETGEPAIFKVPLRFGNGDVLVLDPGKVYAPWTLNLNHGRGAGHSLNDGFRDTRWRRADRAVKRLFGSFKESARVASKATVDEVPLFMAKVLGAGLVIYGVCVALAQYYG